MGSHDISIVNTITIVKLTMIYNMTTSQLQLNHKKLLSINVRDPVNKYNLFKQFSFKVFIIKQFI